jgi:hypothetical protein
MGFEECETGALEDDYEKIAIYGDAVEDEWEHAARQLPSGEWTSKMGIIDDDIVHPRAESVAGDWFGPIVKYLTIPE